MRVLVTGGGTGLGRAVAQALVARGDAVVLCGRRLAPLEESAAALRAAYPQAAVQALAADICGDPEALLDRAGPVEGLVHAAGNYVYAPVGQWRAEHFTQLFAVHVQAPALLTQSFAARLSGPGAVLFLNSTLAQRSAPGAAAYAAAKAAQASLCRSLAQELAHRQVRVNAIQAGVVPTAMTQAPRGGQTVEAQLEMLRGLHPLGRLGRAEEVGEMAAVLLHTPWMTGALVPLDGGLLIAP